MNEISSFFILIPLSGMIEMKPVYNGTLWSREEYDHRVPHFQILGPDMEYHFHYKEGRETWSIEMESENIRMGDIPGRFEIRFQKEWISYPSYTPISKENVPQLQTELIGLEKLFSHPSPDNHLKCYFAVMQLFKRIVDFKASVGKYGAPEERLRQIIDHDDRFKKSLNDYCLELNYSPDHLRVLFKEAYGMTAHEYQHKIRMTKAMYYIRNTLHSVKQISRHLGYGYPSQFCRSFKSYFDETPSEMIKRVRFHQEF